MKIVNTKLHDVLKRLYFGKHIEVNESHRDKWVAEKLMSLENGLSILDAGAGECKYKQYCTHLNYTSQDFNQYTGGADFQYGEHSGVWDTSRIDIVGDILDIDVEDKTFDVILCTEVFEHIPNPDLAIKEFSRIIKDGGILILTAPFVSWTHFAPYHFCTGFNIFWYEKHLQDNGFKIVESEKNGDYFSFMGQEIWRIMHFRNTRFDPRIIIGGRLLNAACRKYSKAEDNHDDLLCFGYHIVAKKKIG